MTPVNSADTPTEAGTSRELPATVYADGKYRRRNERIIVEEPLSIRIDGGAYALVMRSPGHEKAHAAGFCLSEGIIEGPADIRDISFCTEAGVNVAAVTLTPESREKAGAVLERRGFISQTSCGICGKQMAADIRQILTPMDTDVKLAGHQLMACVETLPEHQHLHRKTRSAHAAMLLDADLRLLSAAEDVGRHNALDKAVGALLLAGQLPLATVGVMSSRLSYELVQKAARAQIPVLLGISRPTALAVDLARSVHMTLACVKNQELLIFSGEDRIIA